MNSTAYADENSEYAERPTLESVHAEPTDDLLDVLGDEYTITVLRAVLEEPLTVSAVAERTEMSRTTAYRRLDRLADLGLVAVTQRPGEGPGINPCDAYLATVDSVTVTLTGDGYRVALEREATSESDSIVEWVSPAE